MNAIFVFIVSLLACHPPVRCVPQAPGFAGVDAQGRVSLWPESVLRRELVPEASLQAVDAIYEARGQGSQLQGKEELVASSWWRRMPWHWLSNTTWGGMSNSSTGLAEVAVDCRWGSWSPFSACSRSCAGGRRSRSRRQDVLARGGGAPCEGGPLEEMPCGQAPCPSVGGADLLEIASCELDPSEQSRSYSSVWHNGKKGTRFASSKLNSDHAWCAKKNDMNQWMQIKLGKMQRIYGVVTRGAKDADQWVTEYRVSYSQNETGWKSLGTYVGNHDRDTKVRHQFPTSISAHFLRIEPISWSGHISMRAGAIQCGDKTAAAKPKTAAVKSKAAAVQSKTAVKPKAAAIKPKTAAVKPAVLGPPTAPTNLMPAPGNNKAGNRRLAKTPTPEECAAAGAVFNPPEWWRRYSSSMLKANESSTYYEMSKLDTKRGGGAWCANQSEAGQWMQLYLHRPEWINGTIVQGCQTSGSRVTTYSVASSMDGEDWSFVAGNFTGPLDGRVHATAVFAPVRARFVRLYPLTWNGHICMRSALLACNGSAFKKDQLDWIKEAKEAGWWERLDRPAPGPPQVPQEAGVSKAVNCAWRDWEEWTPCTKSCGFYGVRRRERDIKVYPQSNGTNCEGKHWEAAPCNRGPCPGEEPPGPAAAPPRPVVIVGPAPPPPA